MTRREWPRPTPAFLFVYHVSLADEQTRVCRSKVLAGSKKNNSSCLYCTTVHSCAKKCPPYCLKSVSGHKPPWEACGWAPCHHCGFAGTGLACLNRYRSMTAIEKRGAHHDRNQGRITDGENCKLDAPGHLIERFEQTALYVVKPKLRPPSIDCVSLNKEFSMGLSSLRTLTN